MTGGKRSPIGKSSNNLSKTQVSLLGKTQGEEDKAGEGARFELYANWNYTPIALGTVVVVAMVASTRRYSSEWAFLETLGRVVAVSVDWMMALVTLFWHDLTMMPLSRPLFQFLPELLPEFQIGPFRNLAATLEILKLRKILNVTPVTRCRLGSR